MAEHFGSSPKKGRGRSQRSVEMIDAMREICGEAHPITGRGVGYKLFAKGIIPSMATSEMKRVYRLLRQAREEELIPWNWIVDETRQCERALLWSDPEQYAEATIRDYRRDMWDQQPARVEVWSEKGTVRGVLQPVLDKYGVAFRVMHGFSGATPVYDVAQDFDGRPLFAIYVGDYDPSGLYMSECDLPRRIEQYGGDHVRVDRVAIREVHTHDLPSFPASSKKKDPRHQWFVEHHGTKCVELDAMDPGDLREEVEIAIMTHIFDQEAWERCARVQEAERQSLVEVLSRWSRP